MSITVEVRGGNLEKAMRVLKKKVQKVKPGIAYNMGSLDKSKKPAFTKDDIDKGVKGRAPKPDYDTYKKGSYHDYDVGGDNPPVWEKQPKNEMGGK